MTIEKIKIVNFQLIENYDNEVAGRNLLLIGGNKKGKTSFINAIIFGLTGKNLPTEATHNGAKNGLIEIDLGDYIARTKFFNNKPIKFELEDKKTKKNLTSPRTYLNDMIGIIDFNIKDFFAKSDQDQVKYFCKHRGINFSDLDSEIEENTDSRKFDKKELTTLKNILDYFKQEDAEKEIIDIVKLSQDITVLEENMRNYVRINQGVEDKNKEVKDKNNEIEKKNNEILKLEADIFKLEQDIGNGKEWIKNVNFDTLKKDLEENNEKLHTANDTNEVIKHAKTNLETQTQISKLETNIAENNSEIERLKNDKSKRMSNAINIEGLEYSVNKEMFLYNGFPFAENQTNTASQIVAGMKIAASMLKDLKILRVDASLIDKVEYQKILDWAKKERIQLFTELVDRDASQLQIIVEDE